MEKEPCEGAHEEGARESSAGLPTWIRINDYRRFLQGCGCCLDFGVPNSESLELGVGSGNVRQRGAVFQAREGLHLKWTTKEDG